MAKDKPKVEVVVKNAKKKVDSPIETPKTPKVPEGMFVAKEGQYKCLKKCYRGISLYKVDSIYQATEGELLPKKFFTKVKRFVEVE